MIKIVNEFFTFNKPRRLTPEEFAEFKELLYYNPSFDFLGEFSFFELRKSYILFVIIAFPLSLILLSIQKEGVNVIFGGFLIFSCMMLTVLYIIPEYVSFLKVKRKMERYFSKLKSDIINSNSYMEFRVKQTDN